MVGLRIEEQRTFGAEPRRENLALEVAAAEDPPAAQTRRSADPEVRIGRMRRSRSLLGLGDQPAVGLRELRQRGVMLVVETNLLYHKQCIFATLKFQGKSKQR